MSREVKEWEEKIEMIKIKFEMAVWHDYYPNTTITHGKVTVNGIIVYGKTWNEFLNRYEAEYRIEQEFAQALARLLSKDSEDNANSS